MCQGETGVSNALGRAEWMDESREAALLSSARLGDRQAFLALVEHYQRSVYRLAYALTRDHEHAAELARDSFARAYTGMKGMPEGKRFFPWVLRIARNLSVTHERRRAGDPTKTTALLEIAESGSETEAASARSILDALRELRPDEQMALALRVVERLPYDEIAELLDHSVGHTLARLSTARGVLLGRIDEPDEDAS